MHDFWNVLKLILTKNNKKAETGQVLRELFTRGSEFERT